MQTCFAWLSFLMYFRLTSSSTLIQTTFCNCCKTSNVTVKFKVEQARKAQKGSKGKDRLLFLTSALDVGEWSRPSRGLFTPWKDTVSIA